MNDPLPAGEDRRRALLEFHDNLLRYRYRGQKEWTDEWLNRVQTKLMEWIETGRVSVQPG